MTETTPINKYVAYPLEAFEPDEIISLPRARLEAVKGAKEDSDSWVVLEIKEIVKITRQIPKTITSKYDGELE